LTDVPEIEDEAPLPPLPPVIVTIVTIRTLTPWRSESGLLSVLELVYGLFVAPANRAVIIRAVITMVATLQIIAEANVIVWHLALLNSCRHR
jgi:hypothetical protein